MSMDELFKEAEEEDVFESFIRKEREKQNLTQENLREITGISAYTISRLENIGVEFSSERTKKKLADYFEVTVEEMVERDFE